MTTALVLIAHGSREAQANADLLHVAQEIVALGAYRIVEPAFLEIAEPTIAFAVEECIAHGAERIILLPYFLSAGVHVREDLTRLKVELMGRHPGVQFDLAEPLGRSSLLVDLVLQRAREATS